MPYSRYAIYYLPPDGALADFGARWLGWDLARGVAVPQLDDLRLDAVTQSPRKYGFHGTLKPPFRLAVDCTASDLRAAVASLAATTAPAQADGLTLSQFGSFLALTPLGDATGIARVAATCVSEIDGFRVPAGPQELGRRRMAGLSARQDALLQRWGYPFVLQEFRFHLTLTGPLDEAERARVAAEIESRLPQLPAPFVLDAIALVGERADGRFELIQRYALSG